MYSGTAAAASSSLSSPWSPQQRYTKRYEDNDGPSSSCNPKIVKIINAQPISNDEAFDRFINYIRHEYDKDYSSGRRRRLDRLFQVADGMPLNDNTRVKLHRIISDVGTAVTPDAATPLTHNRTKELVAAATMAAVESDDEESRNEIDENQDDKTSPVSEEKVGEKQAKKAKKEAKKEAKKAKKEAKKMKKEAKKEAKKAKKEAKKAKKESRKEEKDSDESS